MNFAQLLDDDGEHVSRRPTLAGVPGAIVTVLEFNPRTRETVVIYEGPMGIEVLAFGRKGSSLMVGHE